jgi:hypothetical protein
MSFWSWLKFLELADKLATSKVERVIIDKLNLKRGTWGNMMDGIKKVDKNLNDTYASISRSLKHYRSLADVLSRRLESQGIECEFAF